MGGNGTHSLRVFDLMDSIPTDSQPLDPPSHVTPPEPMEPIPQGSEALCTASRFVESNALLARVMVPEIREAAVAYALRDELLALVEESGTRHLILDVRQLKFIGSIGFLAFLGVRRQMSGQIIFCGMTEPVRQVFQVSRLIPSGSEERPFGLEDTLEAALARLV